MPRTTPTDNRLLSKSEAAERLHLTPWRFGVLAKSSPTLLRARRARGARSYWTLAGIDEYIQHGMLREGQREKAS